MVCEDTSRAIVKVDGAIIYENSNPPITIEVSPQNACGLYWVESEWEEQRFSGINADQEVWVRIPNVHRLYGPILDISIFPYQNNGYDVKILCHGDWQRGEECSPTRVWVSVTAYENTNARNPVIFNTEFAGGGTEAWHLKIFNKDGGEEYYKIFPTEPEYEVVCGCNSKTELECSSDNENGFCCIPCDEIVSRLKALENKL
ncbi:MAG: hypothetical protein AAF383_17570 [Cyanobacteria bacterium P01_A01_bin.83]